MELIPYLSMKLLHYPPRTMVYCSKAFESIAVSLSWVMKPRVFLVSTSRYQDHLVVYEDEPTHVLLNACAKVKGDVLTLIRGIN
jgi:hypothetical protein